MTHVWGHHAMRHPAALRYAGITFQSALVEEVYHAARGELEAAAMYEQLAALAPGDWERSQILHALEDERKHYRLLSALYSRLTGGPLPSISVHVRVSDYRSGLREALEDELEAAEMYRRMRASATERSLRDMFFELQTDEMEHASRFAALMGIHG